MESSRLLALNTQIPSRGIVAVAALTRVRLPHLFPGGHRHLHAMEFELLWCIDLAKDRVEDVLGAGFRFLDEPRKVLSREMAVLAGDPEPDRVRVVDGAFVLGLNVVRVAQQTERIGGSLVEDEVECWQAESRLHSAGYG